MPRAASLFLAACPRVYREVCAFASSFVYCVSVAGVTGARATCEGALETVRGGVRKFQAYTGYL